MFLALLPLWLVMASPVVLAFFLVVRVMRRKSSPSVLATLALALAFSLAAAPVPTPIITVVIPHGLALLSTTYYPNILHGPAMFAGLWQWIIPSLIPTFVVAYTVAWRYGRPPDPPGELS